MARIEVINFQTTSAEVMADKVVWTGDHLHREVFQLPQIFWGDGSPWREANLWAYERAVDCHRDQKTVLAGIAALTGYANWLERNEVDWTFFPEKKRDRCLVRYRGDLIESRDRGQLAPSTVSERMRVVISFYRWAKTSGVLSVAGPLWRDKIARFVRPNAFGMERTYAVLSSELSIPNRTTSSDAPEDGLMPVSSADRNSFLSFAYENASEEIFLFLSLGFFTGMRLGTLADLRTKTLEGALPDPRCSDLYRLHIGPGARPPIATKFGVSGHIYIPLALLERVREYMSGARRLLRESKARPEHKDLVFLTKYGNPYAQRGAQKSVAVNVEMHTLKKKAAVAGLEMARTFKFHQSRATFGTEFARIALEYASPIEAISMVKEALLHRSEASALHYIRFVEKTPVKIELANEFTRSFLGAFKEAQLA
jgi:hypothetical protein